jgi:hypothetical protein
MDVLVDKAHGTAFELTPDGKQAEVGTWNPKARRVVLFDADTRRLKAAETTASAAENMRGTLTEENAVSKESGALLAAEAAANVESDPLFGELASLLGEAGEDLCADTPAAPDSSAARASPELDDVTRLDEELSTIPAGSVEADSSDQVSALDHLALDHLAD